MALIADLKLSGKIVTFSIYKTQVGLGNRPMGVGPEAGQLFEPLRLRRGRRNEAGPESGCVDISTRVIFAAVAAAGLRQSLRRVLAGWRANAHRPAMKLTGVFGVTVKRKDDFDPDFDFDPGVFDWSIMDNRFLE